MANRGRTEIRREGSPVRGPFSAVGYGPRGAVTGVEKDGRVERYPREAVKRGVLKPVDTRRRDYID